MPAGLIQELDGDDEALPRTTLDLTPTESTLCQLLLDVAKYVDDNNGTTSVESPAQLPPQLAQQPVTLRFTGGWVRDKLLNVGSHDIDVAINKMTGYQFGLQLKQYLEIPGNAEKYGLEGVATNEKQEQKAGVSSKSKTVGGLHKIEANPEKSKHLETVTTRILGLDIDLVNLRKETYSDDSRNPQMEFGTPEEDALRRDATVNAMFYNINTGEVEDYTNMGHKDMNDKLLRTPLEPYQTFKDDPLRVLRLIRFASRLGYTIDTNALSAMRLSEIQDALKRKISRERVGIEMEKALRGPNPHEAMRLVFDLGLYDTIFCDPTIEAAEHYKPDVAGWQAMIDHVQDMQTSENALGNILMDPNSDHLLPWMMAAIVPYRNAPLPASHTPGKKPRPPIATSVIREGLKCSNKISDVVLAAVTNQSEISNMVDRLFEHQRRPDKPVVGENPAGRDVLGMAIRRWGHSWRSQVLYALLVDMANNVATPEGTDRKYSAFVNLLQKMSLLDVCSTKPLIDGTSLAKALKMKPGPWMKDALEVVVAYQLRHPDTATPETAIAEVQGSLKKENGSELTHSLLRHFLRLTIRPLFAKAKSSNVTDSGRRNTKTTLPQRLTMETVDETVTKPWKTDKGAYALDLLRWCVHSLDDATVEEVWPFIIPPLLTLLDDWEPKYKRIGAELTGRLFEITSPQMLSKTGLGQVFEDTLLPCLTNIPPITPEDDSIPLLHAVYPALLTLAQITTPTITAHAGASVTSQQPVQIELLDKIIRKGIIYSYTHCNQYPRIVCTLFTHLVSVLNAEGIESVKHLKFVLPMLAETLSHPLAIETQASNEDSINVVASATKALQAVILNGWPRMLAHRGEVLKGLTICWVKIDGKSGYKLDDVRKEMCVTVQLLKAAIDQQVDFNAECKCLVDADGRLEGLFEEA